MKLTTKMEEVFMEQLYVEKHLGNFPTIRLASVTLNNFKSIKHGQITCNCGRKFVPYGTQSDILGIYGQNGSGKTSLIEAISILKYLMSGERVPDEYADCIDVDSAFSELTFTFDVQYPDGSEYDTNGDYRKIVYGLKMSKVPKEKKEKQQICIDKDIEELLPVAANQVKIYDEILKVSGTILGKKYSLKPFCDTSNSKYYITPLTKAKFLIGTLDEDKRVQLGVNKALAEQNAQSFVFMNDTLKLFRKNSDYSVYYQMILELFIWAKFYLFVIDSKSAGLIRLNYTLPVFIGSRVQMVPTCKRFTVSDKSYEEMVLCFNSLSVVLTQIVPGLTVGVKDYGSTLTDDGKSGHIVEMVAKRANVEIPLRCESDGVRKIVSTLNLLIMVYNQKSTTVAYDEFDAGVFEYLLGEILQVIQSSGKGQFIFTSHNMRPLEILKKEFIWFTTTDPSNRFIRLCGIAESNNLRKVYYREIAVHEHYENLYDETKKNLIVSAMRRAGCDNVST